MGRYSRRSQAILPTTKAAESNAGAETMEARYPMTSANLNRSPEEAEATRQTRTRVGSPRLKVPERQRSNAEIYPGGLLKVPVLRMNEGRPLDPARRWQVRGMTSRWNLTDSWCMIQNRGEGMVEQR
ncbi:hypothetical protein SISNIDRAFT_221356 [Sistotremastrum niveocremeum HHB9708]|uniref:Uncharacterized protein n=1 Tax=Sistotremastrum niveocremeum HHB9708 TaxID=1314777 RepID=A0A164QLV3_9AGAM|nr:hypothetical protein SISNIDRAFT_221356 [Sistotremastrum niveocremeum HHB9708]